MLESARKTGFSCELAGLVLVWIETRSDATRQTERRKRCEFASGVDGKVGEANHPRNEPTPPRDVASVQRFVIQTANHLIINILANRPVEVENDAGMARAPRQHGGFAVR